VSLDLERLRAETPGCARRIHFDDAGAGLTPRPVLEATVEHLTLEADAGGYQAAELRTEAIDGFYRAIAELLGCRPENMAFASNATDALSRALGDPVRARRRAADDAGRLTEAEVDEVVGELARR
jgi:selenocysteine lyase/cysteine desulfurase